MVEKLPDYIQEAGYEVISSFEENFNFSITTDCTPIMFGFIIAKCCPNWIHQVEQIETHELPDGKFLYI
jgi:hypothetical protein